VLLADDMITEKQLGMEPHPTNDLPHPTQECVPEANDMPSEGLPFKDFKNRKIIAMEREILAQVLRETAGNIARAARFLHIDYKTIHTKIRKYGISVDRKE
jgi:two-component system nitrogen regulation response regulator GlnG